MNNPNIQRVLCGLSLILMFGGGCAMLKDQHTPYAIVLKNVSHATVWQTNVEFEGFKYYPGVQRPDEGGVGSGSCKSYSFIYVPLAPEVIVTWRTEDGKLHRRAVNITPDLVPRPRDNIVFNLHDGGVVTVERFAESDIEKAMEVRVE